MKRKDSPKLSDQMKRRVEEPVAPLMEYDGSIGTVISTGSTLLDLAISGGRVRGGGIPGGIFVEAFGPPSSGKTVLLCEIAGAIQRQGGEVMFYDPEARLNKKFAEVFQLDVEAMEYANPNTVPEVFEPIRKWKPKPEKKIHGIFADSLAALSTDLEMEGNDAYGGRRAKEFSEELRKTCRVLENRLLVCSNQVRESFEAYGPKYESPGGQAIKFYSSLRLKFHAPKKIQRQRTVRKKTFKKTIGVDVDVEVFKSSVWNPYGKAPLTIIFDYGVDNIRRNLGFVRDCTEGKTFSVGQTLLSSDMDEAIAQVEEGDLETALREEVIDLWEEAEQKFDSDRKVKER